MSFYDRAEWLYRIAVFIIITFGITYSVFSVLNIIGRWGLFKKAGKPGWYAIIPCLNDYCLYEVAWSKSAARVMLACSLFYAVFASAVEKADKIESTEGSFSFILSIVGIVLLVLHIKCSFKLSRAFGHGVGFAVGLTLFAPLFYAIIAFGSSQYIGPNGQYAGNYNNMQGGYDNANNGYNPLDAVRCPK